MKQVYAVSVKNQKQYTAWWKLYHWLPI